MKKYRTLKSIFHEKGQDAARQELEHRKNSGYTTDFMLGDHELFYVLTSELASLQEQILRQEQTITALAQTIPDIALKSYLFNLITLEITSTNEIEGVRSTCQEIVEALEAEPHENKRFREIAKLYLELSQSKVQVPQSLQDIRALYDELLGQERTSEDAPDGKLFRASPVFIRDGAGQTIHTGASHETEIEEKLTAMLAHLQDECVPQLFSAAIGHFMLEATHPFYDGNGRFGRFLLSSQLLELLSVPTVLTLSQTINVEKTKYYKAFTSVEEPLNYAEGTTFVQLILELISQTQEDLIEDFSIKQSQMDNLNQKVSALATDEEWQDRLLLEIFSIIGQTVLFGRDSGITWDEMTAAVQKSRNSVRSRLAVLEEMDLVVRTSSRPLRLTLSKQGRELLGY